MGKLGFVRAAICGCALVVSVPAMAEQKSPQAEVGQTDDKQAEIETRLRAVMGKLLRQDVGLDNQKAKVIEQALEAFSTEHQQLRDELKSNRKLVRELLKQDSEDQQAYQKAIKGFREAQRKLSALREREFQAVTKSLTPKQQAKFVNAMRRMNQRLRKALREYPTRTASVQQQPSAQP